ncbi:FAD-dependent oxidoreductase [Streptomyces sp. DG2A-72]|uniref:FAD-dependent oxidoreductase n=1 Tax=Streptomyces sp. DG2A-72 TaxID=3051386 RepID=UPI00265B9EB9|nr:FAD-dependent oxidoreductase [Streptomyces sp. DG2A-72]MDO0939381.1 FAD-dependent oxidoreductase [Streptomyces sp. DG2A-72]
MSGDRIAVVGASAAGLAAAKALRRHGWQGGLSRIGAEPHLPHDRPPLSKQLLSGASSPERARLRTREQLYALGLDVRLGVGVLAATGLPARAFPGAECVAGVRSLRRMDDAMALRELLRMLQQRVVVVGNGVLGSEPAAVVGELGHKAALAGPARTPVEGTLGPCPGALPAPVHTTTGVDDTVRSVHLGDGTELPADLALTAAGSTPAAAWLAGTEGLDLTDGLGCEAYCAAAPGLYAADVARRRHPAYERGVRIEHRMDATGQGTAAARNLLAALRPQPGLTAAEFTPVPYFWSDQYDLRIQAHGLLSLAELVHTEMRRPTERRGPVRRGRPGNRGGRGRSAAAPGARPASRDRETRALGRGRRRFQDGTRMIRAMGPHPPPRPDRIHAAASWGSSHTTHPLPARKLIHRQAQEVP